MLYATRHSMIFMIVHFSLALRATATVTEYWQKPDWQNAVNYNYTPIDFTGWRNETIITDQYEHLGATFSDGNAHVMHATIFSDGAGLRRGGGIAPGSGWIHISFATPMYWIGVDAYVEGRIQLFRAGQLTYTSSLFTQIGGGIVFGGLVSAEPFDMVRLSRGQSTLTIIDNIYFGPPIPGPGAIALLGLAALVPRRRRNQ